MRYNTEGNVSQPLLCSDTSVDSLMLLVERMSPGGMLLHVKRDNVLSADALRDEQVTYSMGLRAAARLDIRQYLGVRMGRGVAMFTAIPRGGIHWQHLVWWQIGQRGSYRHQKLRGDWPVDMRKIVPRDIPWQDMCVLLLLEGELNTTQTPLDTLLDSETLTAPQEPEKISIPTVGSMPAGSASTPFSDTGRSSPSGDDTTDEIYPDDSISQQFVSSHCYASWQATGLAPTVPVRGVAAGATAEAPRPRES